MSNPFESSIYLQAAQIQAQNSQKPNPRWAFNMAQSWLTRSREKWTRQQARTMAQQLEEYYLNMTPTCPYFGFLLFPGTMQLDHIKPVKLGGSELGLENAQLVSIAANYLKGGSTHEQFVDKLKQGGWVAPNGYCTARPIAN